MCIRDRMHIFCHWKTPDILNKSILSKNGLAYTRAYSSLSLYSLIFIIAGFYSSFMSVQGSNCKAINIGSTPLANDIVLNGFRFAYHIGTVVDNPKLPSEADRNLTIYMAHTKETPFYFLTYAFHPSQLIILNDFALNPINETHASQTTNITCAPDVSYDIDVALVVVA
eukprot:TRINITY_DN6041_c0_g1_i3.p1 TRINITY_DN6041_c0_g1~~TRINITY_DN6041_c0_g1_i3.p1  ORF type:complete len:169 (+),score=8.12 TRINITY_DN6041_c0_g1_i3:73-579(+)